MGGGGQREYDREGARDRQEERQTESRGHGWGRDGEGGQEEMMMMMAMMMMLMTAAATNIVIITNLQQSQRDESAADADSIFVIAHRSEPLILLVI